MPPPPPPPGFKVKVTKIRVPEDCSTLKQAVKTVTKDKTLTTVVLGKGEHQIDGSYLEISSAMSIVGRPDVPKEMIAVVGGIKFKTGISGNCHLQHLTLRQAERSGVRGYSSFTMEDVLVEQCGMNGVGVAGTGVVGRCTNVEVRQCEWNGVAASKGGDVTLIGAKTTVHHNCTLGSSATHGLTVTGASSSTIQLISPLTKEQVSIDNEGGGNWGAAEGGDITQIKTIPSSANADEETEIAKAALAAAVKRLKKIRHTDIDELTTYASPPRGVVLTIEAVSIMFGLTPDHNKRLPKLFSNGSKLLADMVAYDQDNVPKEVIQKIDKYMVDPEFTPAAIKRADRACEALCMWVRAMHKYHAAITRAVKPAVAAPAAPAAPAAEKNDKAAPAVAALNAISAFCGYQGYTVSSGTRHFLNALWKKANVRNGSPSSADIETEVEKAKTALAAVMDAATAAVVALELDKPSINEIRQFDHPPQSVNTVMACVQLMFVGDMNLDTPYSWPMAKKIMIDVDAFLEGLKSFNAKEMSDQLISRMKPLINDPGMEYSAMSKTSFAAANIAKWATNCYKYNRIYVKVRPLLDSLNATRVARGEVWVPDDCSTLMEAVEKVTKDKTLTTIVMGKGEHVVEVYKNEDGDNSNSLEISSTMNIVGDPGAPKEKIVVVGGIEFNEGIQGNCHLQHMTIRDSKWHGVLGKASFTMENIIVENCGRYGVLASGTAGVGRGTNVEVRQCGKSGVVAYKGASITLNGAKTAVHHNCANHSISDDVYGLKVWGSPSSTIQLLSPLTKEIVSTDNGGGGNWGAEEGADIHQIKTIPNPAATNTTTINLDAARLDAAYKRAAKGGVAKWHRSRLMIVGEGRVGKTALLNCLNNEPFKETMSTRGAAVGEACILDRNDVDARGATWKRRSLVENNVSSELERAVVRAAAEEEMKRRNEDKQEKPKEKEQIEESQEKERETPNIMKPNNNVGVKNPGAKGVAKDETNSNMEQKAPTETKTNTEKNALPRKQTGPGHHKVDESHCETKQIHTQKMRQMDDAQLSKLVKNNAYNDLTISTWDYGGQEVFYTLHNLFLNREGVYLCVFNLEHLTTKADSYVEQSDEDNLTDRETYATRSLRFINFWLASIAIHAGMAEGAPVFLVGTHKDCIKENTQIEELLQKASARIEASCNLARSGFRLQRFSEERVFFACDTVSRFDAPDVEAGFTVDPVVVQLRQQIMTAIEEDPLKYIEAEVPCRWLEIYDEISQQRRNANRFEEQAPNAPKNAKNESNDKDDKNDKNDTNDKIDTNKKAIGTTLPTLKEQVAIGEIERIAVAKGVLKEDVPKMLEFYNALGLCVYYQTNNLAGTVILEPQWLIDAISLVINDHRIHGPVQNVLESMFEQVGVLVDGDVHLDVTKLTSLLKCTTFVADDVKKLLAILDRNQNGCVDLDEWINWSLRGIWRVSNNESGLNFWHLGDNLDDAFHSRVDAFLMALRTRTLDIVEQNHVAGWSDLIRSGQASKKVLNHLWSQYPPDICNYLLSIMDRFGLLVKLWGTDQFLVPSLLDENPSITSILSSKAAKDQKEFTSICFHFDDELPPGYFERVQAYLIRKIHRMKNAKESKRCKGCAILKFGVYQCMVKLQGNDNILLHLINTPIHLHSVYILAYETVTSALASVSRDFFRSQIIPEVQFLEGVAPTFKHKDINTDVVGEMKAKVDPRCVHWFPLDEAEENARSKVRGAEPDSKLHTRGVKKSKVKKIVLTPAIVFSQLKEMKKIAIVAACDDYSKSDKWESLSCATNDGALMVSMLERLGWTVTHQLFNEECTTKNIEDAFHAVKDTFGGFDTTTAKVAQVMFFFAGHGNAVSRFKAANEGELIMHDFDPANSRTRFEMKKLKSLASQLPVQQVLLVLDACFSGHVFPQLHSQPNRIHVASQLVDIFTKESFASVAAMTACSSNEYAMEGGNAQNGFFTSSIETALMEVKRDRLVLDAKDDQEAMNFVMGNFLFDAIVRKVKALAQNMTPMYLRIEDQHWGQQCEGDFIFYLCQGFDLGGGGGSDGGGGGQKQRGTAVGTFPSGSSVSAVRELKRAGSIEELESAAEAQAEIQAEAVVAPPPQTLTLMQKVTKIVVQLGIDPSIKAMPNKIAAANEIMGIQTTGSMVQQVDELWNQLGIC